jgi:phosphate starvation-inducible membrane PsiE
VSHNIKNPNDPKLQEHIEKVGKHDHRIEHIFRRVLHWIERGIAAITLIVMLIALGYEISKMIFVAGYVTDVSSYLHNVLTIVVGLEFVRMLIDTTPASILEVLTVAITRNVILNHDDYISILVCVACIAGLFAIRRFLVRRSELKQEMVEMD